MWTGQSSSTPLKVYNAATTDEMMLSLWGILTFIFFVQTLVLTPALLLTGLLSKSWGASASLDPLPFSIKKTPLHGTGTWSMQFGCLVVVYGVPQSLQASL